MGPNAMNDILYWVRGSLNLGGVRVNGGDIPVVDGHSCLILGNDFTTSGRALIDYAGGLDRDGLPFDGTLTLRDSITLFLRQRAFPLCAAGLEKQRKSRWQFRAMKKRGG